MRASDESSGGASSGRSTSSGCGWNVTTAERMPRADAGRDRRSDHLLVAGVDAVEAADRDRTRDRLDVEQALADDHPSTTTGRRRPSRGSPIASSSLAGHEPHRPRLAARLEARGRGATSSASTATRDRGRAGAEAPLRAPGTTAPPARPRPPPAIRRAETSNVADRRAAELEAVRPGAGRLAEIGGDLADVGALRARRRRSSPAAPPRRTRSTSSRSIRTGRGGAATASPARMRAYERAAVDLDGRGGRHRLDHLAGQPGRRGDDRVGVGRGAGRLDLALRVERRRDGPELDDGLVALVEAGQVGRQPGRPPGQDEQEPGRERVERAGVAELRARAPAAASAGRRTSSARRACRRERGR